MGPKGEILLREGTDFGMALLLCVYLPSVVCAELMCGWLGAKAGSRQQGEGGCGRGMVFLVVHKTWEACSVVIGLKTCSNSHSHRSH